MNDNDKPAAEQTNDGERWVAEQLAKTLESAADVLADAAEEIRRLADRAREGARSEGYLYFAIRAHNVAVSALPNMPLSSAFRHAQTADQFRTEKGE